MRRFRQKVQAGTVAAAGDSRFDISMLEEADLALAEYGLRGSGFRENMWFIWERMGFFRMNY